MNEIETLLQISNNTDEQIRLLVELFKDLELRVNIQQSEINDLKEELSLLEQEN